MTEKEFLAKYTVPILKNTVWEKTPSTVFWLRAYLIAPDKLLEMSVDYLSIPGQATSPCSSTNLAKRVVWEHQQQL